MENFEFTNPRIRDMGAVQHSFFRESPKRRRSPLIKHHIVNSWTNRQIAADISSFRNGQGYYLPSSEAVWEIRNDTLSHVGRSIQWIILIIFGNLPVECYSPKGMTLPSGTPKEPWTPTSRRRDFIKHPLKRCSKTTLPRECQSP